MSEGACKHEWRPTPDDPQWARCTECRDELSWSLIVREVVEAMPNLDKTPRQRLQSAVQLALSVVAVANHDECEDLAGLIVDRLDDYLKENR